MFWGSIVDQNFDSSSNSQPKFLQWVAQIFETNHCRYKNQSVTLEHLSQDISNDSSWKPHQNRKVKLQFLEQNDDITFRTSELRFSPWHYLPEEQIYFQLYPPFLYEKSLWSCGSAAQRWDGKTLYSISCQWKRSYHFTSGESSFLLPRRVWGNWV